MKRDFVLPENDQEFLNLSGYNWETIRDRFNWLIIHEFPVPNGYRVSHVSVALRIDSGYPVSQIDMVYFNPALTLNSGRTIAATQVVVTIEGKPWQRWSRHRTGKNPWRPGVDDVSTHLLTVSDWMQREIAK